MATSTAPPGFSKTKAPPGVACCQQNPCAAAKQADDDLSKAVADRYRRLTGRPMVTEGKLPGDFGPKMMSADSSTCQMRAYEIEDNVRRFNRYRKALPGARAAMDVNQLGDKPGNQSAGQPCLTRLPDDAASLNKALGFSPGTLTDQKLRNDKIGFRAAFYRSSADGRLILVPRDTEPHSMVDWQTNTENGAGLETRQYLEMKDLSTALAKRHAEFDLAGYSKGGGLAQEGGLVSPDSDVYVFNSAGLSDANLGGTGNTSYDSLSSRTTSFSAQDDFLTYMNNTSDPAQQIANAQFLRDNLAGQGLVNPISIDYRNPETAAALDAQQQAQDAVQGYGRSGMSAPPELMATAGTAVDPSFAQDRASYLKSIDEMIAAAQNKMRNHVSFRLFPPVRANTQETIPDSLSWSDNHLLSADDPGPNLGKLAQHQMTNVLTPMQKVVDKDRAALKAFLAHCG